MPLAIRREAVERVLQGYLTIVYEREGYIVAYPEFGTIAIEQIPTREELEEWLRRVRFRGVRGLCTVGQRIECVELEVEGHHVVEALYVAEAY